MPKNRGEEGEEGKGGTGGIRMFSCLIALTNILFLFQYASLSGYGINKSMKSLSCAIPP